MPPKAVKGKGKDPEKPVLYGVPGDTQARTLKSGVTLGTLRATWSKCYLLERQEGGDMITDSSFVLEDGAEYTFVLPGLFVLTKLSVRGQKEDPTLPQGTSHSLTQLEFLISLISCLIGIGAFIMAAVALLKPTWVDQLMTCACCWKRNKAEIDCPLDNPCKEIRLSHCK